MSITFLKVKVVNPEQPKKSQECILANGEVIKKPVGNAYFEYEGKIRAAPVIFGDEDVLLLGAATIEALGMILDPIRRQLKPLPMLLM